MDFIKSTDISFGYRIFNEQLQKQEKQPVLDHLSIAIAEGAFVAVLGRNGSGKSTLAKLMNALLIPDEGTICIYGYDSSAEENVWQIRQHAGMVFQNPDNQIIATTVEEDVAFGPENLGVPPLEIRQRVDQVLMGVGMMDYRENSAAYLSGGQKQRIAIAGVLAMKPKCIIFDESTAMLDPSGRKEVLDIALRLHEEEKITIIFITHFMEEAAVADRVIVMDKGQVVMDDIPREIFRQVDKMKALALDVPQVTEICHQLIQRGIPIRDDILTIEEMVAELCTIATARTPNTLPQHAADKSDEDNTNMPAQLQLQDVCYYYGYGTSFQKCALNHINLEIQKGEFIGIIGHTGSGKSTLMQHFNGLLKPYSGSILFNGEDLYKDKKKLKTIRQKVGLVFQYPEYQLFETTVFRDVAFGPTNMGLPKEEIQQRVKNALKIVGIEEKDFEKSPFELSGGQKRRVAIAGILAMEPEVLILDEPTAGLDPKGRDEILSQLQHLHEQLNITILLVSHSMEDVSKLVQRVIVISDGAILKDGTVKEVFNDVDLLERTGLAAPTMSYLMNALRQKGFSLPLDIYTVDAATKILYECLKQV